MNSGRSAASTTLTSIGVSLDQVVPILLIPLSLLRYLLTSTLIHILHIIPQFRLIQMVSSIFDLGVVVAIWLHLICNLQSKPIKDWNGRVTMHT